MKYEHKGIEIEFAQEEYEKVESLLSNGIVRLNANDEAKKKGAA